MIFSFAVINAFNCNSNKKEKEEKESDNVTNIIFYKSAISICTQHRMCVCAAEREKEGIL
jgi:hypothetical protein